MPRHQFSRRFGVKQRPGSFDYLTTAISGAALLQPDQQEAIMAPLRAAFDTLRRGEGNERTVCIVANAMNVAEQLAHRNIANDHADKFVDALHTLGALLERALMPGGSWTLRGLEIQQLDDALWIFGVQLMHCSQREIQDSVSAVERAIRGALHGAVSPSTKVYLPMPPAATGAAS